MVSKYPILLVKVVLDFFLYYIIMYMYGCFTCDLLMSIKNPVNIWLNEKKLVPLHQKTRNNKFNNLKD